MERQIKIGDSYYVVSSDDDYLAAMGNDFEPYMVQLFRFLIDSDDVVADIGANIGLTAILFSVLAKQTYAFEPSPSTFRILSGNLTRNKISNVMAINLGMGAKDETSTITFSQKNRSGGYVSDKTRLESGYITEDICIDTLDHFFAAREPAPTFLKMDVEGFEQNVVQGGAKFLQRVRPIVVLEMNLFCLDVLHRTTLPDFLDVMLSVFPYLYAVDADNTIIDLQVKDNVYRVMYEHAVNHRFPNLVGGFDLALQEKLKKLEIAASFKTPVISMPNGKMIVRTHYAHVKAGDLFELGVSVVNESNETWFGYGQNPVYLSYHWMRTNNEFLIYDGIRTRLKKPELSPGAIIEQQIVIGTPYNLGEYRLVLTMVQEGVCWFENSGFRPVMLDIDVLD